MIQYILPFGLTTLTKKAKQSKTPPVMVGPGEG